MILIGSEASGSIRALKMYSLAVNKIIWRQKGGSFEPPPPPPHLSCLELLMHLSFEIYV